MKTGFIMIKILFILLLIINVGFAEEFKKSIKLPEDLYFRNNYKVQWWYFTGHLWDKNNNEYGYELTFFIINLNKKIFKSNFGVENIYISHFAVSDINDSKFLFSDKADRGAFNFAGAEKNNLYVWVGNNQLYGSLDIMKITALDKTKKLKLSLIPEKPYVFHGENGYSKKSNDREFGYSYYFSNTRMKTTGTLEINGKLFKVRGYSWFDRELFPKYKPNIDKGWDWFAIQLDNNTEIMLFQIREKNKILKQFSSGTFIYKDGKYKKLKSDDFTIKVLDTYRSMKTGAVYPSKWNIKIPSEHIDIIIIPLLKNQEIEAYYTTGNYYWEGACKVKGSHKGRAYVEMTGY